MHVHLGPGRVDVPAAPDPPRPQVVAVVDEDLDLASDPARQLVHRAPIGHVERKDGDPRQLGEGRELGARAPRLRVPHVHLAGPGRRQRAHQRLPRRGRAVGHEGPAAPGVAGRLAQLQIVVHVGRLLSGGHGHHDRAAAPVEPHRHPHPLADAAVLHDVGDDGRPAIEADEPEPPRQTFAEIYVVAVVEGGPGDEGAAVRRVLPRQLRREASPAELARRILDPPAVLAALEREPALGGDRGEAERLAASGSGREGRQPGALDGVLPLRGRERGGHSASVSPGGGARPDTSRAHGGDFRETHFSRALLGTLPAACP